MTPFSLGLNDIKDILASLALSGARGVFMHGGAVAPGTIPPEQKRTIAAATTTFFGLDHGCSETLFSCDIWEEWAEVLYGKISVTPLHSYTFSTSGSTGLPKACRLTQAELAEETESLLPLFAGRQRVISVMPVHHVFGFVFSLLVPKYLRIPVLNKAPLPTTDFFRSLRSGDLILAFPIFWRSLLEICTTSGAVNYPDDLQGVSSAAPCPPEIIEGLLGSNGSRPRVLAAMTEVYGATEFGAIGVRCHCRSPYALLPHWQRFAFPDSDEWGIRRLNAVAAPLPDVIAWSGERFFSPLRRKDSAVQVGGRNVFPSQVAELLRTHPKVRECVVRLMRPDEGVRLKAFVVPEGEFPQQGEPDLIRQLKRWLARRLDSSATPKFIRLGSALPLTPIGKLADWDAFAQKTEKR